MEFKGLGSKLNPICPSLGTQHICPPRQAQGTYAPGEGERNPCPRAALGTKGGRSWDVQTSTQKPRAGDGHSVLSRPKNAAEAPTLWPPDAKSRLIGKDPDAGKEEEKGPTEEEMVGWHHRLNGREFE